MKGIESIGSAQSGAFPPKSKVNPALGQNSGVSFAATLNGFLNDVDQLQKTSGALVTKFAAGEITDVHQVTTAAEEAKVAFNMMMEIRSKVMEGYQEILRMRL